MKKIIALTGYSKSGADTIADEIVFRLAALDKKATKLKLTSGTDAIVKDLLEIDQSELDRLVAGNSLIMLDTVFITINDFIKKVSGTITKNLSPACVAGSILHNIETDTEHEYFIITDIKTIAADAVLRASGMEYRNIHIESTIDACEKVFGIDGEVNAIAYNYIVRNREGTDLYKMDVSTFIDEEVKKQK